jgi:transposase
VRTFANAEAHRRVLPREGHSRPQCRSAPSHSTQRGRPLADAFQKWLRTKRGLISQKGKLADAIRYALSRWKGLTRFLDDGRIKLDNCPVESSIRLSFSARKMRSSQAPTAGAEPCAVIASVIETYKLNDVDPLA